MQNLIEKVISNIKNGTVLESGIPNLKNQIIKSIYNNNTFYFLNKYRILTKNYIDKIEPMNRHHYEVGNYYLDDRKNLDSNSIVYSLGILNDIRFDNYISKNFGSKIFMFDPTPLSIEFMAKQKDKNFNSLFDKTS